MKKLNETKLANGMTVLHAKHGKEGIYVGKHEVMMRYETSDTTVSSIISDTIKAVPSLSDEFIDYKGTTVMTEKGFFMIASKLYHKDAVKLTEFMYDGFRTIVKSLNPKRYDKQDPKFLDMYKEARDRELALTKKIYKMKPNHKLVKAISKSNTSILMGDWCALLQKKNERISVPILGEALRDLNYIYKSTDRAVPMQWVKDECWLESKLDPNSTGGKYYGLYVSVKGMKALNKDVLKWVKNNYGS